MKNQRFFLLITLFLAIISLTIPVEANPLRAFYVLRAYRLLSEEAALAREFSLIGSSREGISLGQSIRTGSLGRLNDLTTLDELFEGPSRLAPWREFRESIRRDTAVTDFLGRLKTSELEHLARRLEVMEGHAQRLRRSESELRVTSEVGTVENSLLQHYITNGNTSPTFLFRSTEVPQILEAQLLKPHLGDPGATEVMFQGRKTPLNSIFGEELINWFKEYPHQAAFWEEYYRLFQPRSWGRIPVEGTGLRFIGPGIVGNGSLFTIVIRQNEVLIGLSHETYTQVAHMIEDLIKEAAIETRMLTHQPHFNPTFRIGYPQRRLPGHPFVGTDTYVEISINAVREGEKIAYNPNDGEFFLFLKILQEAID